MLRALAASRAVFRSAGQRLSKRLVKRPNSAGWPLLACTPFWSALRHRLGQGAWPRCGSFAAESPSPAPVEGSRSAVARRAAAACPAKPRERLRRTSAWPLRRFGPLRAASGRFEPLRAASAQRPGAPDAEPRPPAQIVGLHGKACSRKRLAILPIICRLLGPDRRPGRRRNAAPTDATQPAAGAAPASWHTAC